ncbi:integral membrane protein [Mycobacteroides abscessus subsp. abscessus]|nr:integral membrane protein [Mycobacteroides abscessus subsp. abscessus]
MESLSLAVRLALIFSGIFLWVGMLTGVWKYWQIRASAQARAHYYVDIAHRSSLLYAPASLILAVLAYFCIWDATVILMCVILNLVFFSFSFKQPHQIATRTLPSWCMSLAMLLLIVAELGGTSVLLLGAIYGLL